MLTLPAKLTHDNADALVGTLKSQIAAQPGVVVVGAGQLNEFDSSALAVLLDCRRAAMAAGRAFAVDQLPRKLMQLASLYGVAQLLTADGLSQ
jgi:phospholipid transport system transporter-binding protein